MKVFKLPDLGEGLPDAEIVEWLVEEGDEVKTDQPMVSMETAKAVVEGYPASEITRYAVRHDCGMIIVATNKRGFASSYAGRVTKGVIKRASVPVVVVPPM